MFRVALSLLLAPATAVLISNGLPFSTDIHHFRSNAEKYRAILLDVDLDTQIPESYASKRAHRSHFLLRTSSTPLGPGLNAASSYGITDQQMPLVGYDIITESGTTGFWPTFTTTSANVYIDMTTTRWLKVYDVSGDAPTSLSCDIGEVIVGVRYKSHLTAGKGSSGSLSPIPDIECAKLQSVAQVKAVDVDSIDTRSITVDNSTGNGVIREKTSVVNMKQCMAKQTNPFLVKNQNSVLNTCSHHMGSGSSSKSSTTLIEFLLSVEEGRPSRKGGPPELIDFVIRRDNEITADSLFGTSDKQLDKVLEASIAASQQTAMNKASAAYQANWGTAPSVDQIKQELGATPWSSDQLLAGSSEFISGSLMNGGVMKIVRGFQVSPEDSTQVMMICGTVIGCAHGTCKDSTCSCEKGWSGRTCMERLDPCGSQPCGSRGKCVENFQNESSTNPYMCTCDSGFSGINCEISSDPCQQFQQDGSWKEVNCGQGQCVATSTNFTCECLAGYTVNKTTGVCSVRKVDCVGQWSPGVCDTSCNQIDTFHVSIPAQGAGVVCPASEGEQRTTQCMGGSCKKCMSRDCNGRGSCDSGTGICVCKSGFKGDNCELSTDKCSSSLCSGHGNCDPTQTSCQCLNGWKSLPSSSSSVFCSVDPCLGCPPGQCNTFTGVCSCTDDQLTDSRYPACAAAGSVDCQGQWGPWTKCTPNCEKKRYFTITSVASGLGGKPCSNQAGDVDTAPCSGGSCCSLQANQCLNNAQFLPELCQCQCPVGFQGQFCGDSSATADEVVSKDTAVDAATLALFNTTTRPPLEFASVSADEILAAQATPAPSGGINMLYVYIGAGAGGLLLIGGLAYMFLGKKAAPPAPTDPLLAGLEGMDLTGMDLTGMDLSALGMDAPAGGGQNPL